MAALPVVVAFNLADLQAYLAAYLAAGGEPRVFVLNAIPTVRDAPLYFAAVRDLEEVGWACPFSDQVERAASFANTLHKLSTDVLPALLQNPNDIAALRRLRSCGQAALSVRRGSAAGPADLYDLAGRFSNSLERMARQAVTKQATYTVPVEWLLGKAHQVEQSRDASVSYQAAVDAVLAAHAPQIPLHVISNLNDVHALMMLDAGQPHKIRVIAVDALRDAPAYFVAVTDKVAAGWTCPDLAQLEVARRFAGRLAHLGDAILPLLLDDPEDLHALRDLRACGQGIWKARRHAHGPLADAMGRYSNVLTRAARHALNANNDYVLATDWIHHVLAMVDDDLGAPIFI